MRDIVEDYLNRIQISREPITHLKGGVSLIEEYLETLVKK